MFIHAVLFEIKPNQVPAYRKDCWIWAAYAKKAKGFVSYFTVRRKGYKNQYASVYVWQKQQDHNRFMNRLHDWLVGKSEAKVSVLGYYNLQTIDSVK